MMDSSRIRGANIMRSFFQTNAERMNAKQILPILLLAGILTACTGEQEEIEVGPVKNEVVYEEECEKEIAADAENRTQTSEAPADDIANEVFLKARFGEYCITDQTFEVELSEYSGRVWFVPFRPSEDGQDFHMQIIQDDEVLTDVDGYVPEALQGKKFGSLDAVSFYDMNFDGHTDMVLVVTYGDKTYAAVYSGHVSGDYEYGGRFWADEELSEALTKKVENVSISEICSFLSNGKKNGEFSDYREAYVAVATLYALDGPEDLSFELIHFDEDDIPELAAGLNGYYLSLFTYHDGKVYILMDRWPYGIQGNPGYEYSPGKNNLRYYSTVYAGAVRWRHYIMIGAEYSMEPIAEIETYYFDDVNENGVFDEEERESLGEYCISYIDGIEVSEEKAASYDVGGYEYIRGTMGLEALKAELLEKP